MGKKAFIAKLLPVIAIVLVVSIQFISLSSANPYGDLPRNPNTDVPTISLNSLNFTGNDSQSIVANFTITSPGSWQTWTYIQTVEYKFDNQNSVVLYPLGYGRLPLLSQFNASSDTLDNGEHSLQINVTITSLYNPPPLPSNWLSPDHYYATLTQMVFFSIDNETSTIVSSPLPKPTIVATPFTYFPEENPVSPVPPPTPALSPSPSPTPSPTPTPQNMTASLSESASALNFGNTINFTVSVEGGNAPFTYAWYIDGELMENSTSPHYATDSQPVGSHHVYVEVKDADNNTAKTLSPEFNVLPSLTYMPSSSASPTQQPTIEPTQTPDRPQVGDFAPVLIPASMILLGIVAVGLLVYFVSHNKKKSIR